MLKYVIFLVISIGYLSNFSDCARILCYFSLPLYSRQAAYRSLTRELASRGHQVMVITAHLQPPAKLHPNITEIDVSSPRDNLTTIIQNPNENENSITKRLALVTALIRTYEQQFKSDLIQKIIKHNTFDLLILETCIHNPVLSLSHIFQAPAIIFATNPPSLYEHEIAESEQHALFYPHMFDGLQDHANTYQRVLYQWYCDYQLRNIASNRANTVNKMLRRTFGPDMPSMETLKENVQAVIVSVPWLWDHNRPVTPKMTYIGHMIQETAEELDKDLQSYLDSSVHGVIYLSFGSILDFSKLSKKNARIFLNTFSALPYDILLKCKEELPEKPANVRVLQWLPQTGVLNHPKVKLFITQGGLHSITEAFAAGVPILGVPMHYDQWYNVERCVELKVGLSIYLQTLTEDRLLNAINKLIEDPSFAAETRRLNAHLAPRGRSAAHAAHVVERVLRAARTRRGRVRESCPELPLLVAAALAIILSAYIMKIVWKAIRRFISMAMNMDK